MKSLTGKYFIVGVRYEKTLEDGTNAKTTEQYVYIFVPQGLLYLHP